MGTTKLLLTLETTGDVCSFSLHSDGELASMHTFRHAMHLSERLPQLIEELLRNHGADIHQLTAIAVSLGPGSFTGTRIGVTTAKTMAYLLNIPLYGIPSMAAIAVQFTGLTDTLVVPILPCRANIWFSGAYSVEGGEPEELLEVTTRNVDLLNEALQSLKTDRYLLTGKCASQVASKLPSLSLSVCEPEWPSAQYVGRLALGRMELGDTGEDPLLLSPMYLAPPPITIKPPAKPSV